nr:2'-5' RNA ligase family protein [Fictibacillus phosphorivorans]
MGFLDQETEKRIEKLRDGMKKAGITDYAMRPHVTIATHHELEVELFKKEMEEYFSNQSAIELFFPSIGMFLNSGTLYAAPTKDPVLTDFHSRYHERFKGVIDSESLYAPKLWVPHCTIASHLTHEKLVEAFDYSAKFLEPFSARIESVELLELEFEEEVCTDAKDIFKVELKGNR